MKRFLSVLICFCFCFSIFIGNFKRSEAAIIDASALFLSNAALTYAEASGMNALVSGMTAAEVGTAFSTSAVSGYAASVGTTEAALATTVGAGIVITPKTILITAAAAAVLAGIVAYVISQNTALEEVDTSVVLTSSDYFVLSDGSKFYYSNATFPDYSSSGQYYCVFNSLPLGAVDITEQIDLVVNCQNYPDFWANAPAGSSYTGSPVWSWQNFEIVPVYQHYASNDEHRLDFIFRYNTGSSYYSYVGQGVADWLKYDNGGQERVIRPDSSRVNNHYIIPFYRSSYSFLGFAFPVAYNISGNYPFVCYNDRSSRGNSGTLYYTNLHNYLLPNSSSGSASLSLTRTSSFELPTVGETDSVLITIPEDANVSLDPTASADTILDPIVDDIFSETVADRTQITAEVVSEPQIEEPDIPENIDTPFLPDIVPPWHYVVQLIEDASDFISVWVTTIDSVLPDSLSNAIWAAVVLLVTFGIVRRFLE